MVFLQAAAVALSLSVDAFAASFAYGSNRIKIPMSSIHTINLICCAITGLSLFAGSILQPHLSEQLTVGISFTILFLLGVIKLLDSITKSIIRKHSNIDKKVRFSLFNFRFILHLYADPEKADINRSKTLSPAEAVSLAIALSFDGIAVGFGAALLGISAWAIIASSLITGMIALCLGQYLGNKLSHKAPFNLSWLGGGILIIMAVLKLF